jgi:hypothetical protein
MAGMIRLFCRFTTTSRSRNSDVGPRLRRALQPRINTDAHGDAKTAFIRQLRKLSRNEKASSNSRSSAKFADSPFPGPHSCSFVSIRGSTPGIAGLWLAFVLVGLGGLPCQAVLPPPLKITGITCKSGLVIVNWTNGAAPFQVQCCTRLGGVWQDVGGTTSGFSQTNILTQPAAFYRIMSVSNAIAASADKTAPSIPANLTATPVGSSQVNLSWSASTDSGSGATGLKGYNVYRNGVFLKQVQAPATSASDTGLIGSTAYSYAVAAVDNAFNQSAKSTSVSATTASCGFSISPTSATAVSAGGTSNVVVTCSSGCAWNASSSASWLAVTAGGSGAGNGAVSYSVTANVSTCPRAATMTIAGQTFSVTQAAGPCAYTLSATRASFAAGGGGGSLSVTAGQCCNWTAVGNVPWITVTSGTVGNGNGTVTYSVATNTTTSSRSGSMTIAGQTFSVDQAAAAVPSCAYTLSASSAPCTASGGSGSVNVTCGAGCTWSASSGATWLHTSSSGSGNGTATYTVDANTGTSSRSGTLTIAGQTFTVSQGAAAASTGGQLQWVRTMASAMGYTAEGLSVAADSSGNVVVVGDYAGPMDLGSGPCPHNNIFDAFVAKYTAQGGLLWSKAFGGGARNYARAVAVDSQGNVIVAGDFSGTADFGGMILTAPDPYGVWAADMFVAKYSPSGSLLWVKSFGGASGDMGNAVAVDGSDNIILAGGLSSYGVNFGSGITLSGIDMVLVKLSPSGTTLWAKTWGGLGIAPKAVTVDRYGDVVVSGGCPGTMDLGGGPITADTSGANGVFVAKYSGVDGGYRWARGFGANGNDSGFGITTDPNTGNVVVTGGFMGSANFGGGSVTSAGEAMFLAGYDPAGNFLWVKTYGGMYAGYAMDQGNAVKIDANGNLVVTGLKGSPWNMGGSTVSGSGLFVASYSISGNLAPVSRWIKLPATGTTGGSLGNGVTIDRLGHVSATGSFNNGTVDFGGISATTPSGSTSGSVAQYAN